MGKPEEWNKLPEERKKAIAVQLYGSWRGQYIISQALSKAIDVMKKVEPPHREESNIGDMEILHEEIFPIYQKEMEMTPEQFKRLMSKQKKKLKEVV